LFFERSVIPGNYFSRKLRAGSRSRSCSGTPR